ncbi:uncharacterized protein LOC134821166 isoform X2 [Bolinopsis microptera]|uniref:uncharacterized protein LOC134821166 isoform X2 n=1 Tax=Bolinopsis microptera TaxID=2820187 RepID=UPI00307B08C7
MRAVVLLISLFFGVSVSEERYELTTTPATVTSTHDRYKPGDYPFDIRLVMSPATKDIQDFSFKFFKLQSPWGGNFEAQFVIKTDGTNWKNSGFNSIANNHKIAFKPDVTIPSPDSDGLYTVDLFFSEDGLKVQIMGVEVIEIADSSLAAEIKGWDDSVSDVGISFNPIPQTLIVQLVPELWCPTGTHILGEVCKPCPVGQYSTTTNSETCTDCSDETTTISTGSDSQTDCIEVCTIPTVSGATAVIPSSGTVVAAYSRVTVTCQPGVLSGGADMFYFSCHHPSFTVFGNPTCLGTYTKTVICEGRRGSIACPTGQMIRVHKVTWGASTEGVCSKTSTSEQVCSETQTAQTKIHSLCSDKTSCEIEATVKDLGDPCDLGVQKQLYVEHQCLTYPRAGYFWQRIPTKKSTPYGIKDQPLQFRFTPLKGTNTTRKIRFIDGDNKVGRVEWSEGTSKLSECKKKEINVESNWYTLAHEWTLSVTKDFLVLAREGIPQVRWDFEADDDNNDDDISCKNTWASDTDLSKIKLIMMGPEFNKESWFYTSWSPADWNVVQDKVTYTVTLTKTPLTTHYLQVLSSDTGGNIDVLLTNSVTQTTAEFKVTTTTMTYWIWGCTEDNQPLVDGKCESGLWEFIIQKSYLKMACDGVTLLHFEFSKAPVDDSTVCTNMWDVDFASFKFHADTVTEKYRLVEIPGEVDQEDPTQSTDDIENINCFNWKEDPQGLEYRGFRNTTESGLVCQKWTLQTPNSHTRTPQNHPDAGLGDHNFCRNPDHEKGGPWCYNSQGKEPRWKYCGISNCAAVNRSPFPIKENSTSTWNWAHDGRTNNGVLELLGDGAVKWNNGDRHGSWGLRDNGIILGTTFNGFYHELRYEDGIATLVIPKRSPPSTMTLISVITGIDLFHPVVLLPDYTITLNNRYCDSLTATRFGLVI